MDFLGIADAGALGPLDDQPVDACLHRLDCATQRGGRVIDDDARVLEAAGIARRVAGRRGDEMDTLAQQPVDDGVFLLGVHLQVADRQVDAEGLVGRGADGRELARRHRKVAN